jgi:FkbM family methyltransferase
VSVFSRVVSHLKGAAHRLFNAFGLEIRYLRNVRASAVRDAKGEQWRILRQFNFGTVLDIGANEGQFARVVRRQLPDALVYSFEPLPDVYAKLSRSFEGDSKVFPVNVGLSDAAGTRAMYRSEFSPSSSLLPMADLHREEFPATAKSTAIPVSLVQLDEWAVQNCLRVQGGLLIKIDVQGHELGVINGGVQTLQRAKMLIVEVSFYELYEGQPLFDEIYDRLTGLGFCYRGQIGQHLSEDRNQILFADAVFENRFLGEHENEGRRGG